MKTFKSLLISTLFVSPFLDFRNVMAMPYDEQMAWCSDYAARYVNINTQNFNYTLQKKYNYCMKRGAKNLIIEENKESEAKRKQRAIQEAIWERKEAEEKAEEERLEKIRQREIEDIVDNADDLFF